MAPPTELSLLEIRKFMLMNNCKVTNHALVKHFKQFLTNPETQIEARKQFKTFVNTLSTIKNENNEKYLILRKRYVNEFPSDDLVQSSSAPMTPDRSISSTTSDGEQSPLRPNQPPPYRHPPEFSPTYGTPPPPVAKTTGLNTQYQDCMDEFKTALTILESRSKPHGSGDLQSSGGASRKSSVDLVESEAPVLPPRRDRQLSRENSSNVSEKLDTPKEIEKVIVKSESSGSIIEDNKENDGQDNDNKISVKEATRKFNRYASVEEAKVPSPLGKKKPDKDVEDTQAGENLIQHPKAKEWLLSAARANYQDLAKLAQDHPKLVKLQNVLQLNEKLRKTVVQLRRVPLAWNHLDFVYGKDLKSQLFDHIIDQMSRYN